MLRLPIDSRSGDTRNRICSAVLEENHLEGLWIGAGTSAELQAIVDACRGYTLSDLVVMRLVDAVIGDGDGPNISELQVLESDRAARLLDLIKAMRGSKEELQVWLNTSEDEAPQKDGVEGQQAE